MPAANGALPAETLANSRVREIVGVGLADRPGLLRLFHFVIDPVLLGIGDRRFLAVEAEIDLAQRAAGPRPAHQRLDETGIGGIVFESPFPRQRLARLHGRLGRPINPRLHPFHLCTCILAGLSGRGDWIRTSDFLLPKQALYQTELHPAAPKRPAEPSAFYHSPRRA